MRHVTGAHKVYPRNSIIFIYIVFRDSCLTLLSLAYLLTASTIPPLFALPRGPIIYIRIYNITLRYLYHELMEKRSIKPFPVLRAMALKQDINETDEAIRVLSEVCISMQSTTLELGRKLELLQQAVVNGMSDDTNQRGAGNGGGQGRPRTQFEDEAEEDELDI